MKERVEYFFQEFERRLSVCKGRSMDVQLSDRYFEEVLYLACLDHASDVRLSGTKDPVEGLPFLQGTIEFCYKGVLIRRDLGLPEGVIVWSEHWPDQIIEDLYS